MVNHFESAVKWAFWLKRKRKRGRGCTTRVQRRLFIVQCAHELGTLNKANLISLCYLRNTSANRLF